MFKDLICLITVTYWSREAELVVSSPDTDVLLLLVHMYPHLPVSTVLLTGKGRLKRNISVCNIYNNLGQKRASALLGLHDRLRHVW